MTDKTGPKPTFPLWLSYDFEYHYAYTLHCLRHLLTRLGREATLALWQEAFRDYDETLLSSILATGWEEAPGQRAEELAQSLSSTLETLFPAPLEGVSRQEAEEMVENTPPFRQIRQHFASLEVVRETTTYEALHLFRDGLALLAEAMLDRYGRAGELVFYDAMLEELAARQPQRVEVEEFMARRANRFSSPPAEADMFTAGLTVDLVRASETEVVTRVTACEWARYYRERHPRVGYLLACSVDNAAYGLLNERIRLQRTCTLMEGGEVCDFRVYAL